MRISRVRIENFRNFKELDVRLGDDVVIVGENKVGKSNFLYALRLVLDPSLPDSARQLRTEDFWDGIVRPLPADARIRVVVDLAGFDQSDPQLASLADFLVEAEPMVARLTYELLHVVSGGSGAPSFEWSVYGGDREDARVGWEVRRRLPLDVVPALRDAEGDLSSWRRSPLRPLVARVVDAIDPTDKARIADEVAQASASAADLDEVTDLGRQITDVLSTLVGAAQTTDVRLGLLPAEADRLLRSLRLLLDGGSRGIAEASLGVANTLYLTLRLLEIRQNTLDGKRDHTFFAIEEPEAHLHPHVQRNIYRSLLRARRHIVPGATKILAETSTTIVLTTHSPYVASVAPVRSLVLLRTGSSGTAAVSAVDVQLTSADEQDLERYLDVTRAEMLFARGVVLVEGDAELYVLPRIASFLGADLDALGITVCSVAGVNFAPHVKLLKALGIPFVVLTDYDEDEKGESLGEERVVALMEHVMTSKEYDDAATFEDVVAAAPAHGVFLGTSTFEIDLLRSGRAVSMSETLRQLAPGPTAKARADAWNAAKAVPKADEERFLKDIECIGKGRFAQRLAANLLPMRPALGAPPSRCQGPSYVVDAISNVVDRCRSR